MEAALEDFFRKLEDTLELDSGSITAETTLESINWDSLAALTCLVMLQEDYGIVATNDDLENLETAGDIFNKFFKS